MNASGMRTVRVAATVLALVIAACAAQQEPVAGPTSVAASVPVTGGGTTPGTNSMATTSSPATTSEDVTAETTTTTLDPGAAGSFDDLYLILGPGRQFVPLDDPVMVPAAEVTWLEPDSIILGVVSGDEAHAYPADMMAYHHISNTTIAGEPYLVTY